MLGMGVERFTHYGIEYSVPSLIFVGCGDGCVVMNSQIEQYFVSRKQNERFHGLWVVAWSLFLALSG